MERNPSSRPDVPFSKKDLDELIAKTAGLWEDLPLKTPQGRHVITVGNLHALAYQLRANAGQLSL